MAELEVARQRLYTQHVEGAKLATAAEVVGWLGAVQSQDYYGAVWAVGQRTARATAANIDRAFDAGEILRTHVLRPTWHFVTPADIRWLLTATKPRVHALNAYYYRKHGLDDAVFSRCRVALTEALRGGQFLTRTELGVALQAAGIEADNLGLGLIVMWAELEAIVCSGPRRGKQFTYALLDERVPATPALAHDEALVALARRYFLSHGPATVKDFAWWGSLTLAEARLALDAVAPVLDHEDIDGQRTYFGAATVPPRQRPTAYLLPNYDECVASYENHEASIDPQVAALVGDIQLIFDLWNDPRQTTYPHYLLIDGGIVGTWKRTLKKNAVVVETTRFRPLTDAEENAVATAAERYGEFLGLAVELA